MSVSDWCDGSAAFVRGSVNGTKHRCPVCKRMLDTRGGLLPRHKPRQASGVRAVPADGYTRRGLVGPTAKWIGFRCQASCGSHIEAGDTIAVREVPDQFLDHLRYKVWHYECTPEVVEAEIAAMRSRYRKVGVFNYERV